MVTIQCLEKKFPEIEAIIFDKDGTLEDSNSFLRELAQKRSRLIDAQIPGIGEPLLMAFGLQDTDLDPMGLMAVGSRKENEIAAAAYIAETGRSWPESREIAHLAFEEADKYLQRTPENSPLLPHTRDILDHLTHKGVKLGIISLDTTPGVQSFIQNHQLTPFIQVGVGVEPGGLVKPDPQLFIQTCEQLGTVPQKTLMVGDAASDLQMAKAAKAAGAIAVRQNLPQADVAIADLSDLVVE